MWYRCVLVALGFVFGGTFATHADPFADTIAQGIYFKKWGEVRATMLADLAAIDQCRKSPASCTTAQKKFLAIANTLSEQRNLLLRANRAANAALRPTNDPAGRDVWSAPLQSLASGRGDCEDFAILKYALLLNAGVPERNMRVVVGKYKSNGSGHAFLAVGIEGTWVDLDSDSSEVLKRSAAAKRYYLYYALSSAGLHAFSPIR